MDRKWRTNRSAFDTALSLPEFERRLSALPWRKEYALASVTDIYAVYIMLHIEDQEWQVAWSPEGEFYYFLATRHVTVEGETAIVAPEGDEDAPEV